MKFCIVKDNIDRYLCSEYRVEESDYTFSYPSSFDDHFSSLIGIFSDDNVKLTIFENERQAVNYMKKYHKGVKYAVVNVQEME